MEHFELVEKLVNTFGVSYEKAKEALEASNWDAIDAAIYLEREKNGEPQPVQTSVPQEESQEKPQEAPSTDAKAEEPQPNVNTGTKGSTSTFNIPVNDWKQESSKFFNTIWDFLSKNTFVVKKSSGEVFLDIPIWLMVLLFCAFFWPVVMIMAIVFIMGYRFSFNGPQLGKKRVKNTMNHVENMTEEFVQKVKNAVGPDNVEPVETTEEQAEIKIDHIPSDSSEDKTDTQEENAPSEPAEPAEPTEPTE